MSVINTSPVADVRKVISGKDGGLYDDEGNLMASVEAYQSQVQITNATYQPLGDAQEHGSMTSFKVTLNFTEIVVESSKLLQDIITGMQNHHMPEYTFRGMERSPYNGSEEQVVYRGCVPDGNIDLQNLQYKRPWSYIVNQPPELQSLLTNA